MNFIRKEANGEEIWREMNRRFDKPIELAKAIVSGYASESVSNELLPMNKIYEVCCFNWMAAGCMVVKYEDLFIRGSKEFNRETFASIAEHMGFDPGITGRMMEGAHPRYSPTFTSASPHGWKTSLDGETLSFVEYAGTTIATRLAYAWP
jgi:hypothetical protein